MADETAEGSSLRGSSLEAVLRLINSVLNSAGVGEVVGWNLFYEAVLIDPQNEDELLHELRPLTSFSQVTEGDRVFAEIDLKLSDQAKPLRATLKFVIGANGELTEENVEVDELPLGTADEINDKAKVINLALLGISASQLIIEILRVLEVFL